MERMMNVTLDSETYFPALVDLGWRWNGWLCPRFDRQTAERIAAWINAEREKYDADAMPEVLTFEGDTAVLTDTIEGHRGEYPADPDSRYSIGAFGWCWYSDEEEPED